jgi:hypothetical protein
MFVAFGLVVGEFALLLPFIFCLFFVVCLFLLWWVCLFRWRFGEARHVMVLVDVFRRSSSMGGGLAVASVQGFSGGSFAPADVWWW